MKSFDRRVVPDSGLDDVVIDSEVMTTLRDIVDYEKARAVLFGQWGFGKKAGNDQGASALFYG